MRINLNPWLNIAIFTIALQLTAQEVVFKTPSFPAPEQELLYFLSEDHFFNPDNYNGALQALEKHFTEYSATGQVLRADTMITQPFKNYKTFKKISKQPILDYLGIHEIKKAGRNTFELFQYDSLHIYNVVYTLKNNKITTVTEDTSVYVNDIKYGYNAQDQLVKKSYFNEYGSGVIIEAKYNSKGQIISQSSFDNTDGLYVILKTYTYNNEQLLTHFKEKKALYFVPFEEEEENLGINEVHYEKYVREDTYFNIKNIHFSYGSDQKLTEVSQTHRGFSKELGEQLNTNFNYNLSYLPNQLSIVASLPEKRNYVYQFDNQNNPITIRSYVVTDAGTWLQKKTRFTITYH
ncbi:hypothetical protein [Lacinutrix sp. Hel_I_90]|uniref:hypothetical protein n=1 Tax=Lacinutrix sp. Hel_I_90 TaxID=1249999 RepID=UPI0005C8432B|nr:hypothetical protein [Lacinutrix sp. Hel_I_90]